MHHTKTVSTPRVYQRQTDVSLLLSSKTLLFGAHQVSAFAMAGKIRDRGTVSIYRHHCKALGIDIKTITVKRVAHQRRNQ